MLEGPTAGGAHAWAPFLHHRKSLNFHDVKRSAEDAQLAEMYLIASQYRSRARSLQANSLLPIREGKVFYGTEVYDL